MKSDLRLQKEWIFVKNVSWHLKIGKQKLQSLPYYIMQIKLSQSPVRNRYPLTVSPMSKSQMESTLKPFRVPTEALNPTIARGQYINELSAKIQVMQQKIKDRSDYVSPSYLRNSERMNNKTQMNSSARFNCFPNHLKPLREQQLRNSFQDGSEIRLFVENEKDSPQHRQRKSSKNGFKELLETQKLGSKQTHIKKNEIQLGQKANAQNASFQIPLIQGLTRDNQNNSRSIFLSSQLTREELKQSKRSCIAKSSESVCNLDQNGKNLEVIKNDKIANTINKSLSVIEMVKNMQGQKKTKKSQAIAEKRYCKQFELGIVLGKGKFGEVYLGKHLPTGCIMALKKIVKSKILEYNIVDQFIKQLRLHNAMNHPKIVKFYGFFEEKESFYMVLEYMNGGTLFDYLNVVGTLKIKEAVQFLKDIIEAVHYMHQRSIAHRDIKPQNIVISTQGVAKLCDLGWAAVVENRRRTYCGTLDYASPQILERRSYDISVDIWSIGVLTYEMLMGRAPFEDKDRAVVRQRIVNSDNFELEYSQNVPEQAREFIEWLIQRDPEKRPKISELLQHRMFSVYSTKTNKKAF